MQTVLAQDADATFAMVQGLISRPQRRRLAWRTAQLKPADGLIVSNLAAPPAHFDCLRVFQDSPPDSLWNACRS